MSDEWPFDQPPNCAVITLPQIVHKTEPILYVAHGADDHGWQFLGSGDVREEDAAVVGLGEIAKLDPAILPVADLPRGWCAWRQSTDDEWIRGRQYNV